MSTDSKTSSTWTDIGPTETAAALLVDLMVTLSGQRELYERTGAPVTAANKTLVMDEVFEAWRFLSGKVPLSPSAVAENKFGAWSSSAEEQARVGAGFCPVLYPAV